MLATAGFGYLLFVASLILTAATLLSRKKPKVASLDDALQMSATQGAYIPLVIGRQRLGSVVLWSEDEEDQTPSLEDGPGGTPGLGKGTGGVPVEDSYVERALHGLCVGPASEFLSIRQNNEVIWEGRLSPDDTPSGSTVRCNSEPTSFFRIYWGFPDDPEIPYLGDSETHGISTRYSHCTKILWDTKDLGQSRNWARLEYELIAPCYSQIASSPSEVPRTGTDDGPFLDEYYDYFPTGAYIPSFSPTTRYSTSFTITKPAGQPEYLFGVGGYVETIPIWSNHRLAKIFIFDPDFVPPGGGKTPREALGVTQAMTWYLFRIKKVWHEYTAGGPSTGVLYVTFGTQFDESLVWPGGMPFMGTPSDPGTGALYFPIESRSSDGVNAIHMIDQLLFAKFPYGAGKDRSKFDSQSIEVAARTVQTELIRAGIAVRDGENIESSLAALMQDIGLMIPLDPDTGKYAYRLIRYSEASVDLDNRILLKTPETETIRGDRPVDVVAFTFIDRERNYREVPVKVNDNGQIFENDTQRAQKVPIEITMDRDSISRLAPRRGQEALGSLSAVKIETNHETLLAVPGSRVSLSTIDDISIRYIITDIERDVNSSRTKLELILDVYDPPVGSSGLAASLELDSPPRNSKQHSPAAGLLADSFAIEMPRLLSSDQRSVEVFFGASRMSGKTTSTRVWVSRDDVSYTVLGSGQIVARGTIRAELPAAAAAVDSSSRTFDADYQLDIDSIEDLSLYEDSWRAGRQIMIIGDEVIYLKDAEVTVAGDPCEGLISGLIRGRAGTTPATHAADTPFYIVLSHRVDAHLSDAFLPGKTVYYKLEAVERAKSSGIEAVTAKSLALTGKALTPITPSALRVGAFEKVYTSGVANVRFDWSYHSNEFPRTGLGHQALGDATGISEPGGHFIVSIYTAGEDPVYTATTTDSFFEVPLSVRTANTLDDSTTWTFSVKHVEGSFTSIESYYIIQST